MAVDPSSNQTVLRFNDPDSDTPALELSVGPDARTIILFDGKMPAFGGVLEDGRLQMFGHEARIIPCDNR